MEVPQTKVQKMTRNSARSSSKSSEKDVASLAAEAEAKAPEIESAFEKIDDVAAAEGGPLRHQIPSFAFFLLFSRAFHPHSLSSNPLVPPPFGRPPALSATRPGDLPCTGTCA